MDIGEWDSYIGRKTYIFVRDQR